MSVDEFAHVKALVRELHTPKNVSRPKLMEKTGSADNLDEYPVDHHTYAHAFPTRDQHFPPNSFSIPSLVVTGIDNHDHPYGGGNRRFSNFNLGLRRFSSSFMVFLLCFVAFTNFLWIFHLHFVNCLTLFLAFYIVAVF